MLDGFGAPRTIDQIIPRHAHSWEDATASATGRRSSWCGAFHPIVHGHAGLSASQLRLATERSSKTR
jgi:hypothetical protein